jgi:drug/metabolite transporter (DMT)-like permease
MELHRPSGRWLLGLPLTLLTVLLWGTQPVAIKIALEQVDFMTLVWGRFAFAGLALGVWLVRRGEVRAFRRQPAGAWLLLVFATLSLLGNFVFSILGLKWCTPGSYQLFSQLSHPLVALGAVWVFRERFNGWQWLGFVGVFGGLALFFHDQWTGSLRAGAQHYVLGAAMVMVACLLWPGFALAQKQLLKQLSSFQINGFVYVTLAALLLPAADVPAFRALDRVHLAAAGYCMIATAVAYIAYAEAFVHWEASRVASLCTISPIITVLTVGWVHRLAPNLLHPERITFASVLGGALVISGSAFSSLMRDRDGPGHPAPLSGRRAQHQL